MSPVESPSRQRPKQEQPAGSETATNGQRQVPRPFMTSFLEHLVRNRIITEEVAHEAAEWKRKNEKDRRSITDLLKEKFGLSPDVLSHQMAQFYAFRVIDVNERGSRRLLPAEIIKLIRGLPEPMRQLMMRHKVLPWDVAENQPDKLLVVTPNPAEREIADVARAFAYKKFEICYMKERDWAEYWRQLTAERQTGANVGDVPSEEEQVDLEAAMDRDISRGQLQSLLENLFADAVRVGATDVHIVPRAARKTEVYFRIDGQLSLWYSIEDARTESVVALLKTRCPGLDRYERLAAQEGSLQKTIDSQIVRYQASILPVLSRDVNSKFESVAIKILRDASTVGGLDGLHLDQYSAQAFADVLERRKGLVIVTGPTGNGKTSTLVAALQSVMKPTLSVVSVEDPVKFMVDGVRQVKLGYKLSFDDALQAILRHDPDVVLLGEIRNRAAADVAIRLANTGHLVLCSMQARDTISAILRLYTMNIEPFLIGQGLAMVVAQRLVRKLCERCKEPVAHVNDHLLARLGFTQEEAEGSQFYRAVGCINCVGGYKGRLPIFETLPNSPEVEGAILSSWDGLHVETLREAALRQGMHPLRDTGLELLKRGVTSIEEVASATA